MSVKASVPLPERQEAFARRLVDEGRYPSLTAVIEHSLELLRQETEMQDAENDALKELLDERRKGPFLDEEEFQMQFRSMLARVKASYGL